MYRLRWPRGSSRIDDPSAELLNLRLVRPLDLSGGAGTPIGE